MIDTETQRNRELEKHGDKGMSQAALEALWWHHPITCELQQRPVDHSQNPSTHPCSRSPVGTEAREG